MERNFGETRILSVDLTNGSFDIFIKPSLVHEFLGGRGVNQAILLALGIKRDQEGFPNRLVIGPGSLVGTGAPSTNRTSIDSGNMFNLGIGSGNLGGRFGERLRFSGFDHVLLEGRSAELKFIFKGYTWAKYLGNVHRSGRRK